MTSNPVPRETTHAYAVACDLGTGGCKSSLYSSDGACVGSAFHSYRTFYPAEAFHEQKPNDWWNAVVASLTDLLGGVDSTIRSNVVGIGVSGHSLGMVPLDEDGELLLDQVPIWSDSRPGETELNEFFGAVGEEEWYMTTGNGFPPSLYTVFKVMWLRNNRPDVFTRTACVIGTKDYINLRLTGVVATDYSYASGSGVYELEQWQYSRRLIDAAKLAPGIFPEIKASSDVLGTVVPEIANRLGISPDVKVVAGGVDNSCMALGAKCFYPGRVYNSLGSSSWIAVSSEKPLLDPKTRPYVFTHVVPGQFASATAIFSAGSSFKWIAEILSSADDDVDYERLNREAGSIPAGADGLLFNPSLAGGSSLDKSPNIRGAFVGLSLMHGRGHLVRAVLEGVAFGLKIALDALRKLTDTEQTMTIVGGGAKSPLWRQIIADVFGCTVVKTSIDQQAAALGAAALVMVGCGVWQDFAIIDDLHATEGESIPNRIHQSTYETCLDHFRDTSDYLAGLGERMSETGKPPL